MEMRDREGNGTSVELRDVTKRHGPTVAVDRLSLTIRKGEFFSILGPSGSGKTTTLRLLAGFEQPDSGEIIIEGRHMEGVPPNRRPVNLVFQNYALFPHMTVAKNVAFGLEMKGLAEAEIGPRVVEALEMVRLAAKQERLPSQLSGGEQQRVALARALVNRPAVLLLDEPLGALDKQLRLEMEVELKALQERVGITFLYVTHDQEEALTMSDRLAVMNAGRIVQLGTPRTIYEEPADTYVADFLGVSNLMEVEVVERGPGSQCRVKLGELALAVDRGEVDSTGPAHALIRPERVRIEPYGQDGQAGPNRVPAMVERLVFLGASTQVMLRLAHGDLLQAVVPNDGTEAALSQGTPVHVFLAPDVLRVLGGATRDVPVAEADPLPAR